MSDWPVLRYMRGESTEKKTQRKVVVRQNDPQSSSSLLQSQIASAFALSGQETPAAGQSASLTSTNNFINFCSTLANIPLTNGQQISTASCNPAPMGRIPSFASMPSAKFTQPQNGDVLDELAQITLQIVSNNLNAGFAVNSLKSYLSAPQQLNAQGLVNGHYHLVIEKRSSVPNPSPSTKPSLSNPSTFEFFKDMVDTNGTVILTNGLSAGFYRATVTLHAPNHQPILVPVAQRGSLNDAVYFSVQPKLTKRRHQLSENSYDEPSLRQAGPWQTSSDTLTNVSDTVFYARQATSQDKVSTTLNPSVICSAFSSDGLDTPAPGLTPSLTSTNNFINYCATVSGDALTNGRQDKDGSCNAAPMGVLPAKQNTPVATFTFPTFNTVIQPNKPFTVSLAVGTFATGNFVNSASNFLAAPQQLDQAGLVQGYTAIVIEQMTSLTQTAPTDPTKFTFFKSINTPSVGGVLLANVSNGLPQGVYRMSTLLNAANHQPVLTSAMQRGSIDDIIYFSVDPTGINPPVLPALVVSPSTTSSAQPAPATSSSAPSPSKSSASNNQQNQTRNSTGIIVGAVLGGLALIALILFLALLLRRRRRQDKAVNDNFSSVTPFSNVYTPAPQGRQLMSPTADERGPLTILSWQAGVQTAAAAEKEMQPSRTARASTSSRSSSAPSYHTNFTPAQR